MPELPDWMRASAMIGTDGTDFIPVLLGADGSMYAVLQGEHEGVLRTVKLDDEGRMSAFVIDSQDAWDRMLTIGNAELCARLGSSVIYDKRGQVMFVESFEKGWYRWILNTSGAGAAGILTPTVAATGGYCVKLTGGSDTNRLAGIERRVPTRPAGSMGLEFSFSVPVSWDYILAVMYLYTGVYLYTAAVKLVLATGALQVYDDVFGYVTMATVATLGGNAHWFNTVKLVGNISTGKYMRALFNNVEIDASARTIKVADDTANPPGVKVDIVLYSRDGHNDVMYLDDIILTGAEPE